LLVRLYDPINAFDFRLLEVAIQREAVVHLCLVQEAGNAAEAEGGKVFELVVRLEDVAHLSDSVQVLILFAQTVVRRGVGHLSVGGREVNRD